MINTYFLNASLVNKIIYTTVSGATDNIGVMAIGYKSNYVPVLVSLGDSKWYETTILSRAENGIETYAVRIRDQSGNCLANNSNIKVGVVWASVTNRA